MSAIANYKPLPALEDLAGHGIEPMDYGVVIFFAEPLEKTKGGLILAAQTIDDEKYLAQLGVIVAVSPIAFIHPDWPSDARTPQVGDHVYTSRHPPSIKITGADGRQYTVTQDKEVKAVVKRAEDARVSMAVAAARLPGANEQGFIEQKRA